MGADVYLTSRQRQRVAAWQPMFDLAVEARNAAYLTSEMIESLRESAKMRASEMGEQSEIAQQMMRLVETLTRGGGHLTDKRRGEIAQELVELAYGQLYHEDCYFRDSYNCTNLLWRMGLDYWHYVRIELLGEGDSMSVANMRQFREDIATRTITPVGLLPGDEHLTGGGAVWDTYFTEQRARLMALLDKAIGLGEPLVFSV